MKRHLDSASEAPPRTDEDPGSASLGWGTVKAANRASGRALLTFALSGVWMLALPTLSPAQGCDPGLPRNDQQATGYRPRGDRCEGVYKRQVASFGVQLVSLSSLSDIGDLCMPGQPVHMAWPTVAGMASAGPIHLQAESLRQLLYYRLDTDRAPGTASVQNGRRTLAAATMSD